MTSSNLSSNWSYAVKRFIALSFEYGLEDWKLDIDGAKRRFGCCNYTKKKISLSQHYLREATIEQIENTLTHEVAHAIVGQGMGHNELWRRTHIKLGGNGQRCPDYKNVQRIEGKYLLKCPNGCAVGINRKTGERLAAIEYHRKPKGGHCRDCGKEVIITKR